MQVSLRHERLDFVDRLNCATGTGRSAVERGCGGSKLELTLERPATKQTVNESGVKHVAGTGCIYNVNPVRGRVMEALAIPG